MQDDRVENTAVRLMALLCESDCTQKSRMGQGLLVPRTLLCVFVVSYVVEHSALSRAVNLHNRVGRDKRFHDDRGSACKRQPGIPRILHHIFLEGEAAYWRNATVGDVFTPNFYPKARKLGDRNATFRHEWKTGCQRMMSDWRYRFWDLEAALLLIKEEYSWFLPTFESYDSVVAKGDALRPVVLHAFGGMYLDLDVECYRPADRFLAGHDLVLQAEEHNGKALINAVMASTARHPFWLRVLELLKERAASSHNVLYATGPQVVSEAYKTLETLSSDGDGVSVILRGHGMQKKLTPHVYGLGEFYLPCNWASQDLCAEVDNAESKPAHLAGFHHWAGSWKIVQGS